MTPTFLQLMTEQHEAQLALESAMERLFRAEEQLIAGNPKIPELTRQRSRAAALELVKLLVDRKLTSLSQMPAAGN